jgi:hypothetical protein
VQKSKITNKYLLTNVSETATSFLNYKEQKAEPTRPSPEMQWNELIDNVLI